MDNKTEGLGRKMKKCLLLISVVFLLLNGCGYKDIDRRFFVLSIGIDKATDDKYDVSLKLGVPSSETKTGSSEALIMTEKAETVSEAVRVIKSKVDKELDFSHAKVILFGDKVVKEEMSNIFDWFFRRRDIQPIAWVAIGSPSALDILKVKPKGERVPSNSLFLRFGGEGTETPYITSIYLYDLKRNITERGIDPILPIIEAEKDNFTINKTGILQDQKQVMLLGEEGTKYFNFLIKSVKKLEIKVSKDKEPFFVFSSDDVKTSYKMMENGNGPVTVHYDIRTSGIVEESFVALDEKKTADYEKAIAKEVENEIKKLLEQFQKEKVDPIGFGLRYRGKHIGDEANKIKKWKEIYEQVKFVVDVSVQLESVGDIQDGEDYPN